MKDDQKYKPYSNSSPSLNLSSLITFTGNAICICPKRFHTSPSFVIISVVSAIAANFLLKKSIPKKL